MIINKTWIIHLLTVDQHFGKSWIIIWKFWIINWEKIESMFGKCWIILKKIWIIHWKIWINDMKNYGVP
jgi:hypothetical protein